MVLCCRETRRVAPHFSRPADQEIGHVCRVRPIITTGLSKLHMQDRHEHLESSVPGHILEILSSDSSKEWNTTTDDARPSQASHALGEDRSPACS